MEFATPAMPMALLRCSHPLAGEEVEATEAAEIQRMPNRQGVWWVLWMPRIQAARRRASLTVGRPCQRLWVFLGAAVLRVWQWEAFAVRIPT